MWPVKTERFWWERCKTGWLEVRVIVRRAPLSELGIEITSGEEVMTGD